MTPNETVCLIVAGSAATGFLISMEIYLLFTLGSLRTLLVQMNTVLENVIRARRQVKPAPVSSPPVDEI